MQIVKPYEPSAINCYSTEQAANELATRVNKRLGLVDQLIDSNNHLDMALSDIVSKAARTANDLSTMLTLYNQLAAVTIDVGGEEISLGELARRKAELTQALTHGESVVQRAPA